MQKSQSKILRAITNAPRYVTNHTLHTDVNILYVSDVIHERINKHYNNLEAHPIPLLEPLLQTINTGKGKVIPLQAWKGPEGSRRLRFPDFRTIGT
jgi:hypothetical protein